MRPALVLAAAGFTAIAHADPAPIAAPAPIDGAPRFELLDRGDAVEVIAHHVKAARTAVLPVRSRLEIPITATPPIKRVAPSDATVKLIELDREDATPVLSVKLGFERNDVKALSRFAQAIQVGDDLHLLVPRKLPDGDIAPRLPEPTLPPAIAARISAPAAPAAPTAPAAPAALAAAPTAAPSVLPAPVAPRPAPAALRVEAAAPLARGDAAVPRSAADALAAPATPARAAPPAAHPLAQVLAPDRGDAWSQISIYAALGLALAGAGVWLLRRRRARPATIATIDVIAQRALGGKARVVWLRAGQREMIVAVTAQQVRVLSQWRATESTAALPTAHTHADGDLHRDLPAPPLPLDKPLSPAVSGLLRLRGRTGQMAAVAPEPTDTDDETVADAAWTREILAATTGARR